ncbi:EF-Tu/IF-2/RF-3 family GTPase [Candidatus Nitrosotenuis cloacae]|uniref:EF-Tu/IF-2/RF-3 family GTPase n=1 Tax=Candidatus Nitrosotenuis cloacae TaxID=1603555 RepID=UPI0022815530|nr:EF-Tu/IF-2/RF-3 family GTPase [Candidatus Nitrosotenuis cloacae]
MKSVNFVVLGDQEIAAKLGKKGTATDMTMYDKKESGAVRTWTFPNGFPEKIQPLLQTINLAEYVIFHVNKLDKFTGEQIVALDSLKKTKGILSHSYDVDENTLNTMIKNTVLANYIKVDPDKIKEEVDKLDQISQEGNARVVIDHCFDVKGVGTVILGKVEQGKIRQYDTLKLMPSGAEVLIKSIQMHDDPAEEAESPARVGLAVKGVSPDQVGRGDVLCNPSTELTGTEIELDFAKSPFYKGDIAPNQMCLVNIGLQIKPAKFASVNPLKLTLEKPAFYNKGDICVILKPESQTIRILGSGPIK